MRKSFLLLLTFFALKGFSQNAPAKDHEPKPDIKFKEVAHDFGNIKEGTQATYEFVFTNTGEAPLVLSSVQPSCGCTSPEWSREPIAPGAEGKVKAVYNSYGRPGAFQKFIYIKSNAASGQVDLSIKGTVLAVPPEPISPVRNQMNNE